MKKALITGIAGFAGSHLTRHLLEKDFDVYGFFHPDHPTQNLDQIKNKINLIACDILNEKKVEREIKKIKPDYVFHLAAFSSPAQSFEQPAETLKNNILCQVNLLESLYKNNIDARDRKSTRLNSSHVR